MSAIKNMYPERSSIYRAWSTWEKISFRFAFIFFILLVVPIQFSWYKKLFEDFSFYGLLANVSGFRPEFIEISSESGKWGIDSYATWAIAAIISAIGTAIWTWLASGRQRLSYNQLYYWLRVLVRYRIGLGLIAFGFIKFYPMQMPFPSIANLHTDLGDYAPFKLYWQSVGVSVWYQIFLGFLEIGAGTLMFFRATTAIGAIINAGVLYNIAHANFAYDGAVHVYSSYFVLLSLFLLILYIPDLYRLFIKKEAITPQYYRIKLDSRTKRRGYYLAKALFILVFVFVYGAYRYDFHYYQGRLKEPVIPGLSKAVGHYTVSQFILNGDTLTYSPYDSVRWHDAVFERYSTLVYKVNKKQPIDLRNGTPHKTDLFKDYEFTGRAGGRVYLYYEIDSLENAIYVVNKGRKFNENFEKENKKENEVNLKKLYQTAIRDSIGILKWKYERPSTEQIVLSGQDVSFDSIKVVLDRIPEQPLLGKGWFSENKKYTYVQ